MKGKFQNLSVIFKAQNPTSQPPFKLELLSGFLLITCQKVDHSQWLGMSKYWIENWGNLRYRVISSRDQVLGCFFFPFLIRIIWHYSVENDCFTFPSWMCDISQTRWIFGHLWCRNFYSMCLNTTWLLKAHLLWFNSYVKCRYLLHSG